MLQWTTTLSPFPFGAMPADPKAASVPKAHSVLPPLLLHICAMADGDLVAVEMKWPIFTGNHDCSPTHSPG